MSSSAGPKIITDSIILHLDASDKKSYQGNGTFWNNRCRGDKGTGDKGTLANSPAYNAANLGFFQFNTNTSITIPNNTIYNTQTPTVEVWVKTNSTNQKGGWFEKGDTRSQYALLQEDNAIKWRITVGGTDTDLSVTTSTYMNTSNWYQVVGTYSSGFRRLYINGILVGSDNRSGTISTDSLGITIGSRGGGGDNYNGNLAICKVYNRVLTIDEIKTNFDATKSRFSIR